ncbi:MAG: hypothetical protein ACRDQF_10560, partial [Thermocrispum sp.]
MARKVFRSLFLKVAVAIFSASLAVLGMAVVVPAALGQDDAPETTPPAPEAPAVSDTPEAPERSPAAAEPRPAAAQPTPGLPISY